MIILVVFGHMIENMEIGTVDWIYRVIYLFHMPFFIFITGYFSYFNPKKLILKDIWLLLMFQTLYILFNTIILKKSWDINLQYTTPYWILWYLMVIIGYQFLIPFLDSHDKRIQIMEIALAFSIGILSGYDATIGYYLSLSRFFTFLPFFILGYYVKRNEKTLCNIFSNNMFTKIIILFTFFLSIYSIYWIKEYQISRNILLGSYAYKECEGSGLLRVLIYIFAMCWMIFLIKCIPSKKISIISWLGQNTLAIYLSHGFIVRLMMKYNFFHYSAWSNMLLACLCTIAICIVFGNSYYAKIFSYIFTGKIWIKLYHIIGNKKRKSKMVYK